MSESRPRLPPDTLPASVICVACGASMHASVTACECCGRPTRTSRLREVGSVLGSYRILDVLGEGGMGVVYLAEHIRLGRRVAIKVLRSEYSGNPQAVRRFFGEARAVNRINHPNIVEITDFIEQPGADNYYVMEVLRGRSVGQLLDGDGVPTLASTAGIMLQVAKALEAVHAAAIVHRDLKPDNVFLVQRGGRDDYVKLLDFGVAKLADHDATIAVNRTASGAILGTPEYMSPEQASGRDVDTRSDIYSFGVLLYELVTGTLPLTGTNFGELVVKHLTIAPVPPSQVPDLPHAVPASLEDLILACLAKDVEDRPATIGTVAERLLAIADHEGWELPVFGDAPRTTQRLPVLPPLRRDLPLEPAPPPAPVPAPAPSRRRLWLVAGLAAAVAVAAALVGLRGDPDPAPALVDIEVESAPPGAQVFVAGVAAPLGVTPLIVKQERSDRVATFELRLAGHEPASYPVRCDRPSRIAVELRPLPAATPPPPPVMPPPVIVVAPPEPRSRSARPRDKKRAAEVAPPDPGTGTGSAPPATRPVDRSDVLNPFEGR